MKVTRSFSCSLIALAIFVGTILGACGAANSQETQSAYSNSNQRGKPPRRLVARGSLRPVQWGPWRHRGARIQIGALVSYCGSPRPKPRVERVKRSHRRHRVILTMFVRFFPREIGANGGGCSFTKIGVSRWLTLSKHDLRVPLYDGSTSPPSLRVSR